jgi:hypothetical protein
MTPEQLQQYVDAALKQRDQFSLVFYPLTIVLSIGGAWLISYLLEKGKNLATKEDISEITHKVESIKADLAAKQHFTRIRFDSEMGIYQKVWPVLVDFHRVVYLGPSVQTNYKEDYNESRKRVFQIIRENQPFFPKEVWNAIFVFQLLCNEKHFNQPAMANRELTAQERKAYGEVTEEIEQQLKNIEEAIRNRLSKFD